jgi:hypothetical protein
MKRLLITLCVLLTATLTISAQDAYQVNGSQYQLKTAVEGPISLLWNSIDGSYRYFIKEGDEIEELSNTRVDGKYQEEYKQVLRQRTAGKGGNIDKTKLTLSSLTDYFNAYNKAVDPNYSVEEKNIDLQLLLGPFAGFSNEIFTDNPSNATLLVVGADLELTDQVMLKRHAVVLRFRQTFESGGYKYNASQFSLNYRFKFIHNDRLSVFANAKFVAFTASSRDDIPNPAFGEASGEPEFFSKSGSDLSAPATFGLGLDYTLGNGKLFVTYNDIVGIGVDSNGEFPIDFSVGYRFRL